MARLPSRMPDVPLEIVDQYFEEGSEAQRLGVRNHSLFLDKVYKPIKDNNVAAHEILMHFYGPFATGQIIGYYILDCSAKKQGIVLPEISLKTIEEVVTEFYDGEEPKDPAMENGMLAAGKENQYYSLFVDIYSKMKRPSLRLKRSTVDLEGGFIIYELLRRQNIGSSLSRN